MAIPVVPVPHPSMRLVYEATCISFTAQGVTGPGHGPVGPKRNTAAEAQADWDNHVAAMPAPMQHEGVILQYIAPI